jgi:hypothetical protein
MKKTMEVTEYSTGCKFLLEKKKINFQTAVNSQIFKDAIQLVVMVVSEPIALYIKKEPSITVESIKAFFEQKDEPEWQDGLLLEQISENKYKIDDSVLLIERPGKYKVFQFVNEKNEPACRIWYNNNFNTLHVQSIENGCRVQMQPNSNLID